MQKKSNDRVVLAITYHPKLPSISKIILKHWRTLIKDPISKRIFQKPPMLAFKQPPNLGRILCRAKLPKNNHPKRKILGLKKCLKPCNICLYVYNSKDFNSTQTGRTYQMKGAFNCNTLGVVYLLTCLKCKKQYVGQTGRKFSDRVKEHLYCIQKQKEAMGEHFCLKNHSSSDLMAQIIEKVMPNTPQYRLEREEMWIRLLETRVPFGLNKMD